MTVPIMPPSPSVPAGGLVLLTRVYWLSNFLLAAAFVSVLVAVCMRDDTGLLEAWLLIFATASTFVALVRQLPAQNVFLVAALTALIGAAAHTLGVKSGLPFGPFLYGSEAGLKLFGTLPWVLPLLWIVVVLNSRGVARLVLRPWRKTRAYGFWLMGLTALFAMLFDYALEPVATHVRHYWIWTAGGFSITPMGSPISNSIGWFIVTLLILAFATPALINKQLSKRSMPDFHPLVVWLGGVLLFATGAAFHGLWLAVGADITIAAFIAGFSIRGARW